MAAEAMLPIHRTASPPTDQGFARGRAATRRPPRRAPQLTPLVADGEGSNPAWLA
jgi:hypothetical protein